MRLYPWLWMALLIPACASATPEDAGNRFVDLWNLDEPRLTHYPQVFSDDFIQRRGADGLDRILTMLSSDNGDITIHEVSKRQDKQFAFVAHSAKDKWVEIALDLDPEFKITGMQIRRSQAPLSQAQSNLSLSEVVQLLEREVDAKVARGEFSGSVLLAKDGKPLFARAYGLADRESGRANTLDTPINLGSMNKMFTGLAITQLVAAGKLRFDAKVGEYLPDYPNKVVREQITLHQLLTHTGCMGMYWNDAYAATKDRIHDLAGFVSTFVDEPLRCQPGSEFHYSNSGPVVLGLVIEAVSGMSYYDYIREHIYGPAGMQHSDHYSKRESDSGKAKGYFVPEGQTQPIANTDDLGNMGSPAGGGYASANDLLRFANALYDGRLIDAQHREQMTRNKLDGDPRRGYGYLYGDSQINGMRYIGHNGGAPGINAEFSIFPEQGYTVVVLANVDQGASALAGQIRQWLAHAKTEGQPPEHAAHTGH